jgi:DNA polymerase-1
MNVAAFRQQGYQLLQDGLVELAYIEGNGIRVDVERMERKREELTDRMRSLRKELEQDEVWHRWRKRFGERANLESREQLTEILHGEMKFEIRKETESGEASADEEALSHIKIPFIKPYIRYAKYNKCVGTYFKGILREVVNGRLHPVFNLHTVRTYRSSCDSPNFQNMPVRNKEISSIVRTNFLATSPDYVIVENDFKGIEVSISACYHKDKNFIKYIENPEQNDMHRDMAAQIFKLGAKQISKETRHTAKNKFVFPQFYGDYYLACAKGLWEEIGKQKLNVEGVSLYEHLKAKGIDRLGLCDPEQSPEEGTFEAHLQQVEDDFWNNRFREYGQWRKDFYRQYLNRGYFDILSGFRVSGNVSRNGVTNYPVQGAAFHCLLWCLIQVNRTLRKYKMRSKIVGQIHDSLIGDVYVPELRRYLEIVQEALANLHKFYPWIRVPLEIEYEIAPSDGTWHDKQEVKFKAGQFKHPAKGKDIWTSDPIKFVDALNQEYRMKEKTTNGAIPQASA